MADTTYIDRPMVYVAAPYTRPDPVENTNRLIHAVNEMVDEGVVTPIAPHLTLLWHLITPRPLEFWYAYDIAMLARCDALIRLPGSSTGADAETAFAMDRGLPVFHDKPALYAWAKDRHG